MALHRRQLVINPAADPVFVAAVERIVERCDRPAELERRLHRRFPLAVVRGRDLDAELTEVWYVYRDGRWVRGNEPPRRLPGAPDAVMSRRSARLGRRPDGAPARDLAGPQHRSSGVTDDAWLNRMRSRGDTRAVERSEREPRVHFGRRGGVVEAKPSSAVASEDEVSNH
jgi:hypothetical protein